MGKLTHLIRGSIPAKICISILLFETVLLTILGLYYTTTFNNEIDIAVRQKLVLPSVLMSERALNYQTVQELEVMSELLDEDVQKAFVVNKEGKIFYGSKSIQEGADYHLHLTKTERAFFGRDIGSVKTLSFDSGNGGKVISVIAPIQTGEQLLGGLYLQIDGSGVSARKQEVAFIFFLGAFTAILLTTVLEAFYVYRLMVPRVNQTSQVLSVIKGEDFSTRITEYGAPDQLGRLMAQVDSMIGRVSAAFDDLRIAEEKNRDLFMSAKDGIFRLSEDGKLLEGNPAIAEMLGFTSVEEMNADQGTSFKRAFVDTEGKEWNVAGLSTQVDHRNVELSVVHRDGGRRTVSLSTRRLYTTDGAVEGYEGSVVDITDLKKKEKAESERMAAEAVAQARQEMVVSLEENNRQLETAYEKLKTTQQQLLNSERMATLGMTAGGVAHDLNNILSGLTTYPEFLLLDLPEDSHLRQPLEAILTSGRKATAVVSDMQTLSRGVTGRKENISLNDLIQSYLDSLEFRQLTSDNGKIKVVTELESRPTYVYCSPIHIQKLIMNLVTNGMEAMVNGGTLTISTSIAIRNIEGVGEGDEQSYCVLDISDTGDGIRPEDIEHIFDPFYTRKVMGKSGTGLGLTIVQSVVQSHNGTINLKSDSNGTAFTVYLPLGFEPAHTDVDDEVGRDMSGTEYILVVDDEPLQRELGFRLLSSLGYNVGTAASGEEALLYLEANRVDILILDMIMAPGISGLETYERAIEIVPDLKAIIVSGFAPDNSVKQAIELGLQGFLAKPYSISDLATIIRQALDS